VPVRQNLELFLDCDRNITKAIDRPRRVEVPVTFLQESAA
jgi:hypothetical protein